MKRRKQKTLTSLRPKTRIAANLKEQAPNNSHGPPTYYEDHTFACADCGTVETWTALQQKRYYEEWKKPVYGVAKQCRACRRRRREEKPARRASGVPRNPKPKK